MGEEYGSTQKSFGTGLSCPKRGVARRLVWCVRATKVKHHGAHDALVF